MDGDAETGLEGNAITRWAIGGLMLLMVVWPILTAEAPISYPDDQQVRDRCAAAFPDQADWPMLMACVFGKMDAVQPEGGEIPWDGWGRDPAGSGRTGHGATPSF